MRFERERCSRDDADVNAAVSLMIMWWSDLASRSLGLRRFRLYLDSFSFRVRLSGFSLSRTANSLMTCFITSTLMIIGASNEGGGGRRVNKTVWEVGAGLSYQTNANAWFLSFTTAVMIANEWSRLKADNSTTIKLKWMFVYFKFFSGRFIGEAARVHRGTLHAQEILRADKLSERLMVE